MLNDAHDEGEETLTLRLSNPSGGELADGDRDDRERGLDAGGAAGALRAGDGRAGGHAHRGADGGASTAGLPGAVRRVGSSRGRSRTSHSVS